MNQSPALDEDLLRRLPLPIAQLLRRAVNAKSAAERHHAAFYVWEATLKLLGSVAIVEYAACSEHVESIDRRLEILSRPSLGHWWEFIRRLLPVLSVTDEEFGRVQELWLGRNRDDLPRCAGLLNFLLKHSHASAASRSTVRLAELIDEIVRYRNQEIGHGAVGQRPREFYFEAGNTFLAAALELLQRFDPLVGRCLVYVDDVRRLGTGEWLIERFHLQSETPRRIESIRLPEEFSDQLPRPGRSYLPFAAQDVGGACLHPLFLFELETGCCSFLNSRRRRGRAEYLCYTTGEIVQRESLTHEHRELLVKALKIDVASESMTQWDDRSEADDFGEPVEKLPSRMVGEFELLSRLGQGGMGTVYRAWQPSLARQVALKTLIRTGDPQAECRFAREIRALGSVEHRHLVKVYTSGSQGDQWFYTMELIDGVDLASVCRQFQEDRVKDHVSASWRDAVRSACEKSRLQEQFVSEAGQRFKEGLGGERKSRGEQLPADHLPGVVEMVRQIALAADALHTAGVLHRDIKPANIMVDSRSQRAVLTDLGLARLSDELDCRLTKTRQFLGTLRYASPEQLLAIPLDSRADIYSLGATLWELLTLQPLFGATEATPTAELMLKIQAMEPVRPSRINPDVPRDLDAIVLKCLEKDRNRRYATAADLAADLACWQRGEPVRAHNPSCSYLAGKYLYKHRASVTVIALVFTIVMSLIGGLGCYAAAEHQSAIVSRCCAEKAEAKIVEVRMHAWRSEQAAERRCRFAEEQLQLAIAQQQTKFAWKSGIGRLVKCVLLVCAGLDQGLGRGQLASLVAALPAGGRLFPEETFDTFSGSHAPPGLSSRGLRAISLTNDQQESRDATAAASKVESRSSQVLLSLPRPAAGLHSSFKLILAPLPANEILRR